MSIEAMKQWREALKQALGFTGSRAIDAKLNSAIMSIDQDIEQTEKQEPVGSVRRMLDMTVGYLTKEVPIGAHLYTYPQPKRESVRSTWVGLTDNEVRQMCGSVPSMKYVVREAEAKLKAKNFATTEGLEEKNT